MANCEFSKKITKITPDDGHHYFFGYYDLYPYDAAGKYHLAHRVKFADRLPEKEDVCEVGVIDVEKRAFKKVGETTAWNFQQGAFLNWYSQSSIIYNAFIGDKLCSVIKDLNGETVRVLPMPIASISQDKKWALSINFARIFSFRPGYGYAAAVDEYSDQKAPKKDGVYLLNTVTGESELLISYFDLAKTFPQKPFTLDKLVINHVTFNPSANKFIMLFRNKADPNGKRGTQLLVIDTFSKKVSKLTDYQVNSHYSWKNDDEFMIWSLLEEGKGIYFFNANTGERKRLNNEILDRDDVHCLYSPNQKHFIGDSYPYVDGFRHIYKYNFEDGSVEDLIKVKHNGPKIGDIRCDLHARYHESSKIISFDGFFEDFRAIYQMSLED